jgi:hypothetical protein
LWVGEDGDPAAGAGGVEPVAADWDVADSLVAHRGPHEVLDISCRGGEFVRSLSIDVLWHGHVVPTVDRNDV